MKTILASELDDYLKNLKIIDDDEENCIDLPIKYIHNVFLKGYEHNDGFGNLSFHISNNKSERYCNLLYNLNDGMYEKFIIPTSFEPELIKKIVIIESNTGEVLFEKIFKQNAVKIEKSDVGFAGSYIDNEVYRVISLANINNKKDHDNRYSYTYISNEVKFINNGNKIPVEIEIEYI